MPAMVTMTKLNMCVRGPSLGWKWPFGITLSRALPPVLWSRSHLLVPGATPTSRGAACHLAHSNPVLSYTSNSGACRDQASSQNRLSGILSGSSLSIFFHLNFKNIIIHFEIILYLAPNCKNSTEFSCALYPSVPKGQHLASCPSWIYNVPRGPLLEGLFHRTAV